MKTLVELVREHTPLKEVAPNIYMGKCPFHPEETPSFMINKETYYCFSCGEEGNIDDFNLTFRHVHGK